MSYTGFLSLCSSPIPNSPYPRGYSISPGASSFHQLLEYVIETGGVLSPPHISLTPTLHPSDLIEHYQNPDTNPRTHFLDKNTSDMLSQLEKIGESNDLITHQQIAVSLRLNNPPALEAVIQDRQPNLDEPISVSSPKLVDRDTAIPTHPRLTALGLSVLFSQGSPLCLRILLRAGASVNSRDGEGRTALHWAVLVRDRDTLRLLLSKSADPLIRDQRGDTPLHLCCRVGDHNILSMLIKQLSSRNNKSSIDVHNSLQHSPLFEASSLGHYPCVRRLLRAGADPTIHSPLNRNSLHAACLSGSYETVQLLIRSSYSKSLLSAGDCIGAQSIHYASALHRTDMIQLLQAKGASLYAQDEEGHNMLHYLALYPAPTDPITTLFSQDRKIRPRPDFSPLYHIPSISGVTPLHIAALTGCIELVRELLAYKCIVNSFDKLMLSPLSYAAIMGHNEIVNLFSTLSPSLLNKPDLYQNAMLHYVTATGNVQLTELFLSNSLSNQFINHQNREGRTPLHLAVIHAHPSCTDLLLGISDIDVNVPDSNSWSPLHYAISLGSFNTAKLLLERGAKFDSNFFKAISSIVIAIEKDYTEMLQLVMDYGYSANTICPNGTPLLHLSIYHSSIHMTQLLLLHGAGIDTPYLGLTPLDYSLHTQQPVITDMLVSLGARTQGGVHHRAAALIQLRYKLLLHKKRQGQRIAYWTPILQNHVRCYLGKKRLQRVRQIKYNTIVRAVIVIQRHWRSFCAAKKKYEESYEVLRARLRTEKAAYALILEKIKERETRATTVLKPVRNMSRQKKARQIPTYLPPIPMVHSAPCVAKSTPLPQVKPPSSKLTLTPPPKMTACIDQYKSLTDQYQTLRVHLATNTPSSQSDSVSLKTSLKQALNQAIILRSDTDRLSLPLLPPDSTRAVYHLKL
ncbi:Ankyrin repeat protein [Oopsacas minuta]|uniref:Ankyrin repeat protein n=1 Tax=Oopsacas minuta TaxID=111878 RepID=A0AAV7JU21_9METZ|nr:Ankyrin repeat protein [Oopsacas minuta]